MSYRPIVEGVQDVGTITQYAGTVNGTPSLVPATPGDQIVTVLIRCPDQTPNSNRLLYNIDGTGNVYHVLSPGEVIAISIKGSQTQIRLKAGTITCLYEVTIITEPT
jgi:hypothetical protein